MKCICYAITALLLLALLPLPLGYYTFLRIAVSGAAVYLVINEYKSAVTPWLVIFAITGLIFNPVIPVYLYKKALWMPIDITVALLFFIYSFKK